MAAHPSNGNVYLVNETECSYIVVFSAADTTISSSDEFDVGPCYDENGEGLPIAIDSTGTTLYMSDYYSYNGTPYLKAHTLGGSGWTALSEISFSGFSSDPTGSSSYIQAMAVNPDDGKAYVAFQGGEFGEIVLSTSEDIIVTYIGTLSTVLDGLVFVPSE